eukprot:CAMPEP_0206263698 /NCGR_PEP_ID=MMETSP0047_2-20121206/28976_1 /ASSEMBLY_ACC=CAM_ASM_000192 /TAXON_ID=195065 /ORGANISM="Chroomonas mesostigmatica_cf, Strain CCMP1168" /LENGTH=420 /DNA_ID=CAMNT_0053691295 /DNA_START=254 /DNA_END=1516 /DNA_ORIENTATION=+
MSVKEMRAELNDRGVYHQDCFEKAELVARLQEARVSASAASEAVESPAPAGPSASGNQKAPQSSASEAANAGPLLTQIMEAPGSFTVALERHRAQDGVLGSQTKIDEEYCYALPVRLSELGVDCSFIMDTAAGNTLVSPSFAARTGAKDTGVTASVSGGTAQLLNLKQVNMGPAAVIGASGGGSGLQCGVMQPIVMELPVADEVAGILGVDLLPRLGLTVVSFTTRTAVMFQDQDKRPKVSTLLSSGGLKEVPMFFLPPPTGLYYIKVRLSRLDEQKDSQTLPAIVDMGSPFSIMNWAAIRDLGLSESSPLLRKTTQVVAGVAAPGQGYNPVPVNEVDLKLKVGGVPGTGAFSTGTHKFCVADLATFASSGFADKPAMILGLDILAGQLPGGQLKPEIECLAFDIGEKRLWMTPAFIPRW